MSEKKTFEVAIEPGARHGQKIVLRGEAGISEPGLEPGDVVLVVAQKVSRRLPCVPQPPQPQAVASSGTSAATVAQPGSGPGLHKVHTTCADPSPPRRPPPHPQEHSLFQRMRHNSQDLVIQKDISLRDALTGVSFTVKHLDGRLLRISSPPGEVVKPGSFMAVADEGMPFPGRPYVKGNLYINFQVRVWGAAVFGVGWRAIGGRGLQTAGRAGALLAAGCAERSRGVAQFESHPSLTRHLRSGGFAACKPFFLRCV